MEATWSEEMFYDDAANNGAGALELHGDVVVRNKPDALEENDLDAGKLRLDFVQRSQVPRVNFEGTPAGDDELLAFSGSRDLGLLVAQGDARLESRSWNDTSRESDPDLFQISGKEVRYDARTGEGSVPGAGVLLINQVEAESKPEVLGAGGISIGGNGTTRFSWRKSMHMRHDVATRYVVTMVERVEILHAGAETSDTLTLSAEELEVTIDRPVAKPDSQNSSELDLGGQAEVLRVAARGKVFVRTTDHDVECEFFDYDAANQIAQLTAREGRFVTIMGRDSVAPVRAEKITWDMRSGRMQITGARGGAGR